MHATAGDRIVVRGHHLGEPDRDAEVLEVHGEGGTPPFLVRWSDDGHVALYVPGPDARVDHLGTAAPAKDGDPPAAPLARDLRTGIVAVRADVARLRAIAGRAAEAGGDLWGVVAAEAARSARRIEAEADVVWGTLRAAEADSVEAVRQAADDTAASIRTLLDEARVQADLGAAEAEDAWNDVTARLRALREDPAMTVQRARGMASEVFRRLRAAIV
jgi:hypothetical protein